MDTIPAPEAAQWSAARAQAMENPPLAWEHAEVSAKDVRVRMDFWLSKQLGEADEVARDFAAPFFVAYCEHLTRAASYEPLVTPDAYRKSIREWSRRGEPSCL